jgi:sulfoxide reductase heme-binding subunit YedZ
VLLICGWQTDQLGVDPEKTVIWETGIWTFNLLITVLILPVIARWARWSTLLRYRRAVGLWVFAYASAHFVSFLTFLLGWDITRLGEEVTERPYVLAGFSADLDSAVDASPGSMVETVAHDGLRGTWTRCCALSAYDTQ